MDRKLAVLVLVGALLLAGCIGGGGDTSGATNGTENATTTDDPAPSAKAIAGEHPAVTEGTLNASSLMRDHLVVLRQAESFTVLNNRTFTYVENGSVSARTVLVNKADTANQRQRVENRVFAPDGTIQNEQIRFWNATTTCRRTSYESEENGCFDGGVSTQRIIANTVETTSLETVGAPKFSPDGIAERESQSLYRYTAAAFRASMDSKTGDELYGADPTLVEATLLVHPNGRIVEYSLTYRTGDETSKEADLTWVTTDINATTFESFDTSV